MSKQQRSLRDKERELSENSEAGAAAASAESECDRDKEVMQRCLKLLMMGRSAPQTPAPKVSIEGEVSVKLQVVFPHLENTLTIVSLPFYFLSLFNISL